MATAQQQKSTDAELERKRQRWTEILAQLREAERTDADHSAAIEQHDAENAKRLLDGKPIDTTNVALEARQTISACKDALPMLFTGTIALLRDPDQDADWHPHLPTPYPADIVDWLTEKQAKRRRANANLHAELHEQSERQRIERKIEHAKFEHEKRLARENGGEMGLVTGFNRMDCLTEDERTFYLAAISGNVNVNSGDDGEPLAPDRALSREEAEARAHLRRYDMRLEDEPFVTTEEAAR